MTARQAIQSRLEPGEALLWAQAAPADELFADALPTLVFVAFFLVVVAWVFSKAVFIDRKTLTAEERRKLPYAWAFMGLFAAVGLAITYVAVIDLMSASSTSYGLTDRRVIIARELPFRTAESFDRTAFARMLAAPPGVGPGTVEFDHREGKGRDYRARLQGVPNPEALAARIRETLGAERDPESPN